MVMQNPAIPWTGGRIILWDQAGDYAGVHCGSRASFVKALRAGIASGKGCRVAFSGAATVDNFEWWCEVCWSVLDGNHITHMIAEELSVVCPSSCKATDNAPWPLNQSRKYGGVLHGVSQKPQEVAKTYFDQCGIKFIGQQKGLAMRRRMAAEIGLTEAHIGALDQLEFYRDDGTAAEPELIKLKYKAKRKGSVRWID